MLSEPMPEAAPVGGIAMPDEPELVPELLPEGVLDPAGGVMVNGLVDGDVGLIGAGVDFSSIFLPHAPSTSMAESAKVDARGLKLTEFMRVPFKRWVKDE